MLTLVWFAVGGLVGWGAAHGGPAVQRAWPVFLRIQILATSATLSLVAAWRLTSVGQLLGPLALSAGMWLLLGATLVTRGERSAGQSSLEAWAVTPNASFWVVPTAATFAGSAGTMIAVLANVITTAWNAVAVQLIRHDAPVPPAPLDHVGRPISRPGLTRRAPAARPRTGSGLDRRRVDPGRPPAGVFRGRPVHRVGDPSAQPGGAPDGARAAPLELVDRGAVGLLRAGSATAATLAGSTALTVVAVLTALSAPSFQPVQLAVLYGYRSEVVVAAVRWGWVLAPLGLAAAAVIR